LRERRLVTILRDSRIAAALRRLRRDFGQPVRDIAVREELLIALALLFPLSLYSMSVPLRNP
jgi:hypothetical protein